MNEEIDRLIGIVFFYLSLLLLSYYNAILSPLGIFIIFYYCWLIRSSYNTS